MPHFTLQYCPNIPDFDLSRCLTKVNSALADSGHFDELDIKSRAFKAEEFLVGVEARGRAFVAGSLFVLSGRSDDTRRELGALVLGALTSCVPANPALSIQVTVEVVEIQRDTYAKTVISA